MGKNGFRDSKDIRGVQIQGRKDWNQWVTKFKVSYSINGSNYTLVDNGKIFTGNNDRNTINDVLFNSKVKARYVRIHPQKWYRHISMRCGVIEINNPSSIIFDNPSESSRAYSSFWYNNNHKKIND